jgi:hypothetical protein
MPHLNLKKNHPNTSDSNVVINIVMGETILVPKERLLAEEQEQS